MTREHLVQTRIDVALYRHLASAAKSEGLTVAAYLRRLIIRDREAAKAPLKLDATCSNGK
jgi:hypothetical protein